VNDAMIMHVANTTANLIDDAWNCFFGECFIFYFLFKVSSW